MNAFQAPKRDDEARHEAAPPRPRIAYFVYDLADAAVLKRLRMFRAAGADVVLLGFHRGHGAPEAIEGTPVVNLGRTYDGRLLHRAFITLRCWLIASRILRHARGADILIGRNLEALALASRTRSAAAGATLIYECLDLHRMLLRDGPADRILQRTEAMLLKHIDRAIISSPAFAREYFDKRYPGLPTMLVENKILALEGAPPAPAAIAPSRPWTVGWFGMLRCRKSFDILQQLAEAGQGSVRVLIAGRPSPAVFADLPGLVAQSPHMEFAGSYTPEELPALYRRCHFSWCIDFFEEGLNSKWLLPNRLYESIAHGAVPIALDEVETGRWLAARPAGILLKSVQEVPGILSALDDDQYRALQQAVADIPRTALFADLRECEGLLHAIAEAGR